jgi:Inositol monophosphatase family
MRFTPLRLSGAVAKALCVADDELIRLAYPRLNDVYEPVVGAVSMGAWAHDLAAAVPIVRGAGGFACGLDGGEPSLAHGKNGGIFANSHQTMNLLLEAVRA